MKGASEVVEAVCGGIVIADIVVRPVDRMPRRGFLESADTIDLCVGGCAANTGSALARLGVKTALVGRVGNDNTGRFLRDALAREGLDLSALRADPKLGTSATNVLVASDGERTFVHTQGANAALTDRDFPLERFPHARLLHCGGILLNAGMKGAPLARLLRRARKLGLATSVDTVWDINGGWLSFVEEALPYSDIFFANESEALRITGRRSPARMADFFIGRGVKTAVIKRGEKGSLIRTADSEAAIPAYKVKCVDTTGAGDAYVGGFLFGRLRGWRHERCGRFGAAVAALSTLAPGAVTALPSYKQTVAALRKWDPGFDSKN
jgi:sugar/nucleoside kinase (ribokinase family)